MDQKQQEVKREEHSDTDWGGFLCVDGRDPTGLGGEYRLPGYDLQILQPQRFGLRLGIRNDSVCVSAFEDPAVPGVTCHISQARKGGWGSVVGLTEDPSQFSIACRQTGPITLPDKLPDQESVFSERTSAFFKNTKVVRMFDRKHNTLIYLAISRKIIEGSPQNAISTVPIMPWGGR